MSVFKDGLLKGRTAFITGGGSGIGAGIARRFAAQGARVALLGRTPEKLEAVAQELRAAGAEASCHPADVRQYGAVDAALCDAAKIHGGIDILVNSAAGNFLAPAASLSANGFRAVVDIDLCGTFNACRAAFAHLTATRGCVVSITATQATVPMPLQCHAGAAKAGIEKLTRDLALEWGRLGVRVNSVAPGPIEGTEGMTRLAPGDTRSHLDRRVPLGRYGRIDEVADAVLYLVSPAAAYITGASLTIDGGAALLGAGPFLDLMGE
ncbi:MAG: SDR family oxidoreductase [Deltaproteobacteria bacterium]|nr:SDR family oxidoreductase [Deltaproteobacteria bacterium]